MSTREKDLKLTNEDLKAIKNSLPELEKLIKSYIGNVNLRLSANFSKYKRKDYITIESKNLVGAFPILKTMYDNYIINIESFDEKDEDNSITFNSYSNYHYIDSGSNYCNFIWKFIQFKDGKWDETLLSTKI